MQSKFEKNQERPFVIEQDAAQENKAG